MAFVPARDLVPSSRGFGARLEAEARALRAAVLRAPRALCDTRLFRSRFISRLPIEGKGPKIRVEIAATNGSQKTEET
jgi:hypothetical protein